MAVVIYGEGASDRWLDKTPIYRIITRCTQDTASSTYSLCEGSYNISFIVAPVDGTFAIATYYVFDVFLQLSMKLGAIILVSPIFVIPGIVVIVIGGLFGRIYMKAQLPVKRESSKAKAPVLGHFGSAVSGLGQSSQSYI